MTSRGPQAPIRSSPSRPGPTACRSSPCDATDQCKDTRSVVLGVSATREPCKLAKGAHSHTGFRHGTWSRAGPPPRGARGSVWANIAPLRGMGALLLLHQPDRPLPHVRGERLTRLPTRPCLSCHAPNLLKLGASAKPGAVQPPASVRGVLVSGNARESVAISRENRWRSHVRAHTVAPKPSGESQSRKRRNPAFPRGFSSLTKDRARTDEGP